MEKIWFKDPYNFINETNYDKFFPSASMTYTEKLNSLVRLAVYFSVFVLVIKKEPNVLYVPIFACIVTYFLFVSEVKKKKHEEDFLSQLNLHKDPYTEELCYKPTQNNPFMNVLISDYVTNPKRGKACNITQSQTRKKAQEYFNTNLYRDVSDVFQKNASDRNFITMPNTTIPNDDGAFKHFLYDIKKTCKEGSGKTCYSNAYRHLMK